MNGAKPTHATGTPRTRSLPQRMMGSGKSEDTGQSLSRGIGWNGKSTGRTIGFMSCHVIVQTAYPFPWGCRVLLLEPIPALSQGEGRVLPG